VLTAWLYGSLYRISSAWQTPAAWLMHSSPALFDLDWTRLGTCRTRTTLHGQATYKTLNDWMICVTDIAAVAGGSIDPIAIVFWGIQSLSFNRPCTNRAGPDSMEGVYSFPLYTSARQ